MEIRGLTVRFGKHTVLDAVDLELRPGELLGLVGRNGSGKSTLVRAITRIVSRASGTIHIFGEPVESFSAPGLARQAAVVPQAIELPAGFAAIDVVLMGRTPYLPLLGSETETDLRIARAAMARTDTEQLAERRVDELSGGERQRLLLARALAQQTPILLLDEPTAHLDIGHQAELMEVIASLRRESRLAVLAVVHDLTLAAHYCDRLVLLHDGRVLAEGVPEDVISAERLTAAYGARVIVIPHPLTGRPVVLPDL
ncbi:MAG: ABC transporter ATP-binding protein [Dehalococcoidia bacterium]